MVMNDTEKLTIAHQFTDMLKAIKIDESHHSFQLLLLNDAILNMRECVWSLVDCNKTDELLAINNYINELDKVSVNKNEQRLQGIALIINGLKLLVESAGRATE